MEKSNVSGKNKVKGANKKFISNIFIKREKNFLKSNNILTMQPKENFYNSSIFTQQFSCFA